MFTLTLPNGYSVQSMNHLSLASHIRKQSKATESKVNYFKWAAYPELSEGKIIVAEAAFLTAVAAGSAATLFCTLTISDAYLSKTFQSVSIVGIEVYNGYFASSNGGTPDRLLCLTLRLDRRLGSVGLGYEKGYYAGSNSSWSELVNSLYVSSASLKTPTKFNKYINYFNDPIENIVAFIANSQFQTAYPSTSGITFSSISSSSGVTTNYSKAVLTTAVFNPATINPEQVLFVDSGTTYRSISLLLKFMLSTYQFGVMEYWPDVPTVYPGYAASNLLSNVSSLITPECVSYVYPFELMDAEYVAPSASSSASGSPTLDPASPLGIITAYYTAFQQNCINRLSSRIHLVVQGVVTTDITNDVHRITYAYDERGGTTTLESVPWKLPLVNMIGQSTNNVLFVAKLNQDMESEAVVLGDIYHPVTMSYIEGDSLVYDTLGLITRYCKGTYCYVVRTLSGSYVIVSGPCNQTTACPSSSPSSSSVGE